MGAAPNHLALPLRDQAEVEFSPGRPLGPGADRLGDRPAP